MNVYLGRQLNLDEAKLTKVFLWLHINFQPGAIEFSVVGVENHEKVILRLIDLFH